MIHFCRDTGKTGIREDILLPTRRSLCDSCDEYLLLCPAGVRLGRLDAPRAPADHAQPPGGWTLQVSFPHESVGLPPDGDLPYREDGEGEESELVAGRECVPGRPCPLCDATCCNVLYCDFGFGFRGSTIVASQIPVDYWHESIGEQTVADAIMDRIVHSSIRISLAGESLRKFNLPRRHNL